MRRTVYIAALVVVTLAFIAPAVHAQPPLPFLAKGTVRVNGENVPDGTVIRAWCDGIQAGSGLTQLYQVGEEWFSLYQVPVQGDNPSLPGKDGCYTGDTVEFTVDEDEILADQTATWVAGAQGTVNLTAFRPTPSLALVKQINGVQVESPPGPVISAGETVTFTYLVSNTGNVALDEVVVNDDQEPGLSCEWPALALQELVSCTITGTAVSGSYHNVGTAVGVFSSTLYGTTTVTVTAHAYYHNAFSIYLPVVLRN